MRIRLKAINPKAKEDAWIINFLNFHDNANQKAREQNTM